MNEIFFKISKAQNSCYIKTPEQFLLVISISLNDFLKILYRQILKKSLSSLFLSICKTNACLSG